MVVLITVVVVVAAVVAVAVVVVEIHRCQTNKQTKSWTSAEQK